MKRIIIYLSIALGILLGSVLLTIALFLAIDINNYKSEIESLVLEKTGRKLHIEGDLQRSLFPWLGVSVGAVRLNNAPGFGDQDFAKINGADIRVKVAPLFFGALEVDVLTLKGLGLDLARNADGVTNWDDLLTAFEVPPTDVTPSTEQADTQAPVAIPKEAVVAFSLGGIRIQDAQISWQDHVDNRVLKLTHLNWEVSEIKEDTPIAYELDLDFDSSSPEMMGHLSSKATFRAELIREYYQLTDFALQIQGKGEGIPGGKLDLNLTTNVNLDYKKQKLDVNTLTLKTLGLIVTAALKGKDIIGAATVESNIKVQVADENMLSNKLSAFVPENTLSLQPELLKNATVVTKLTAGIESGDLSIEAFDIQSPQINLVSHWNIKRFMDSPRYKGALQIKSFNPTSLLQALGLEHPKTTDPNVLHNADVSLNVAGTTKKINITELKAILDKTHVTANVQVNNFTKPAIKLDVEVDRINLDHYLPPAASASSETVDAADKSTVKSATATTTKPEAAAKPDEFAALKTLDLNGKLFVKALTLANAKLQYIDAIIKAKDGVITINPLKFNLYDGATLTDLTLDVRVNKPKLFIKNTSTTIATGPLLRDVYGDDVITGIANMQMDITAQGMDADTIMQTLNGKGNFSVNDGVLDVDLETYFNDTYQKYKKLTKNPRKSINKTAFEKISGTYTLSNGVLSNNDLNGKLRRYRISGRGKVDLPKQHIDYVLDTTVVKTSDAKKDQPVSELRGHTIPIKIRGPLDDPSIKADFGAVAKAAAKKAIKKEQKKMEEKAEKAIDKEVDKLEEKYDIKLDKLKGKLKDLF